MKKTSEYDKKLPSLPSPTLEHTLERYLDSVRAVGDDHEYAKTKQIVEQFAKGSGQELHQQLKTNIEKQQERNWKLLIPPEILQRLEDIVRRSDQNSGLGLDALTALSRDEWAEIGDRLCQISEQNRRNLQMIEQASVVYASEDDNAENLTELVHIDMLRNPQSRWFDRSIVYIVTRNGLIVTNSDHSAYEGVIPLQIGDHIQSHIDYLEKITSWSILFNLSIENPVEELVFVSDSYIINSIDRAISLFSCVVNDIEVLVTNVDQCTKEDIKQYVHIHPDTFCQLCLHLQLAYFQLHKYKSAPTYETASTQRFYRGRTETLRTCTPEVVAWCRTMTNHRAQFTDKERRKLFLIAANRHRILMSEASKNQGCNRHLMGLNMIAYLTGKAFDLTNDLSWVKSGGSGNFLLSTSCVGFSVSAGGTAAMCSNGYRVFYRIDTHA